LLGGIIATLAWFFCGYKPLNGGAISIMRWAAGNWTSENDLEHGPLIIPGAIVVACLHYAKFASAEKRSSWLGIPVLLFGILMFLVGVWVLQPRVALVALPFLLIGCVWSIWGWPTARVALFPCLLLLFLVPVGFLLSRTEPLQRLIASVVTTISNLVGIGLYRDGVDLLARDGSFKCQVAGGCSGVRSIMAMTLLSFIYVHFSLKEPWKKLATIGMTLPFAVIGNVFRVFTIVLVSKWFGQSVGTGPWHDISGFIITIPIAVGAMIFFGDLLNRDWTAAKTALLKPDTVEPTDTTPEPVSGTSEEPPKPSSRISYDY
jgi:exosortase